MIPELEKLLQQIEKTVANYAYDKGNRYAIANPDTEFDQDFTLRGLAQSCANDDLPGEYCFVFWKIYSENYTRGYQDFFENNMP